MPHAGGGPTPAPRCKETDSEKTNFKCRLRVITCLDVLLCIHQRVLLEWKFLFSGISDINGGFSSCILWNLKQVYSLRKLKLMYKACDGLNLDKIVLVWSKEYE